jgi:hypothetical protein
MMPCFPDACSSGLGFPVASAFLVLHSLVASVNFASTCLDTLVSIRDNTQAVRTAGASGAIGASSLNSMPHSTNTCLLVSWTPLKGLDSSAHHGVESAQGPDRILAAFLHSAQ